MEKNDCKHCWHSLGYLLASLPPKYPEICCHCGEKRTMEAGYKNDKGGHGAFKPKQGAR